MKMIGMSVRSAVTRFCRSRPLRPGSLTSRIRQLGARTRGRARNSCADSNVSGCQPAVRISDSSDSRTEMSSSTTNTIGISHDIDDNIASWSPSAPLMPSYYPPFLECKSVARRLARSKSSIERPQQSRIAEWFGQALHCPLFEQARADCFISVSRNEDDRDIMPAKRQFPLEIRSRHSWHGDIEDQASGLTNVIGRQELLRRRERLNRIAEPAQQVW